MSNVNVVLDKVMYSLDNCIQLIYNFLLTVLKYFSGYFLVINETNHNKNSNSDKSTPRKASCHTTTSSRTTTNTSPAVVNRTERVTMVNESFAMRPPVVHIPNYFPYVPETLSPMILNGN